MRSIKLKSKSTQFIYNSNHIINPLKSQLFFHLFCLKSLSHHLSPSHFLLSKSLPFCSYYLFSNFFFLPNPLYLFIFFLGLHLCYPRLRIFRGVTGEHFFVFWLNFLWVLMVLFDGHVEICVFRAGIIWCK